MTYTKYAWVGNKIAESDMAALYKLKIQTKRPITELVAEAISRYVREVAQ